MDKHKEKRTKKIIKDEENLPQVQAPLGENQQETTQNTTAGTEVAAETSAAGEGLLETEMVKITKEEHAALQRDLEQARQQAQEYFDGWQRERADFSNYKKRQEREHELHNLSFSGNFIKKFLVIQDDLDRAIKTCPTQDEGAAWAEGITLITRKLNNILEKEGVQPIPNDIQTFDPTMHEAITHEDSPNHESGQIIEVVQQGYMIGDRVLRPALVRVAR
ncbi:MAG: nucleotide exchange factor GrpE [Planctomycetes bacterium]|nr:nucleotide exchange factor GrpE [Planctomycetota bacterium]